MIDINDRKESRFSVSMTGNEVRTALFKAAEGKSKAEIEVLLQEYESVSAAIPKRELEAVSEDRIID